jgi:hypothetical protein
VRARAFTEVSEHGALRNAKPPNVGVEASLGGEVKECISSDCASVRTGMSSFNVRSGATLAKEPHLRSRKERATEQLGALSQHVHHEGANLSSQPLQHLRASTTGSARRRLIGERNRNTGPQWESDPQQPAWAPSVPALVSTPRTFSGFGSSLTIFSHT